jgi:hypothetical protein
LTVVVVHPLSYLKKNRFLMYKAKLPALLVVLCICNELSAQVELINVTPLSPNSAAMAKYGETSVGHFTGIPGIVIPIHTIQSGELVCHCL